MRRALLGLALAAAACGTAATRTIAFEADFG
jgi:hypothetical protein